MSKKRTNPTLVQDLGQHTARDQQPHLGDLVFWSLVAAEVERGELLRVWSNAGLPADHLPDEPSAERAFRMAVREAQVGHHDRLLRTAHDDGNNLIVGIVFEHRVDAELEYKVEARLTFEKKSEALHLDDRANAIGQRVLSRFGELRRVHPLADVRAALVENLESLDAIQLRSHGGVLWVPGPNAAALRRLKGAIDQIGDSCLYLLPISASEEGRETLTTLARHSLEEDLAELKAEIDDFIAAPPEREATLIRRLDAFAALRQRAAVFESVLSLQVDDLGKQIGVLERTVGELVEAKHAVAA